MKLFTDEAIAALNAQTNAGLFFRAIIISDPVQGNVYFCDLQHDMTFDGHMYTPRPHTVTGLEMNSQMRLPTIQLGLPDPDGTTEDYMETINMIGRDVTLQVMHLDATIPTLIEAARLRVMAVGSGRQIVTFSLGINIGLGQMIPRDVIGLEEFPSIPTRFRRASVL